MPTNEATISSTGTAELYLFGETDLRGSSGQEAGTCLNGLARAIAASPDTEASWAALEYQVERVPRVVEDILEADAQQGITYIVGQGALRVIVSKMFERWEEVHAKTRDGLRVPVLLEPGSEVSTHLVRASARGVDVVAERAREYFNFQDETDQGHVADLVALRGPAFAAGWLDRNLPPSRSLPMQWVFENTSSVVEAEGWRAMFSQKNPSLLKWAATAHVLEPTEALDQVKEYLSTVLSDEGIAEEYDYKSTEALEQMSLNERLRKIIYEPEVMAEKLVQYKERAKYYRELAVAAGTDVATMKRVVLRYNANYFQRYKDPVEATVRWLSGEKRVHDKADNAMNARLVEEELSPLVFARVLSAGLIKAA